MMRTTAILGILFLIAGCCPKPKSNPYYGPTLTMTEAVATINTNNQLIPSLWANTKIDATFMDGNKKRSVDGRGAMLFRRPGELFLDASHALGPALFDMGSNAEQYWFTIPENKQAWWGHHRNAGKPCVQDLPIRPDLLVEVLGIATFNTNFLERPVPVMRFNHDERAYMFVWHDRLPTRWAAQKEIWYDLQTLAARRVILFDENGRTILRAELSDPEPVEVPELPKDKWPKVATKYDLTFPQSKARLKLELSDVVLRKQNKARVYMPNDGTFIMPEEDWDGFKVTQIDKNCKD